MRQRISPKFHVKNGVENGKFHANFTLLGRSAEKSPRVRKIFVRNSGAGNGCVNFMDAWKNCALSAGKKPMSIKFLVLGGGGILGLFGGGGVPILFLWARGFF